MGRALWSCPEPRRGQDPSWRLSVFFDEGDYILPPEPLKRWSHHGSCIFVRLSLPQWHIWQTACSAGPTVSSRNEPKIGNLRLLGRTYLLPLKQLACSRQVEHNGNHSCTRSQSKQIQKIVTTLSLCLGLSTGHNISNGQMQITHIPVASQQPLVPQWCSVPSGLWLPVLVASNVLREAK